MPGLAVAASLTARCCPTPLKCPFAPPFVNSTPEDPLLLLLLLALFLFPVALYCTVLGMINYGHRARIARGYQEGGLGSRLKAMLVGKGA